MEAGLAQRAWIILLAAEGLPNAEIARRVGVSRPTVVGWRSRYLSGGVAALVDLDRSGRPRVIDEADVVVATLTAPPAELGVTHWSARLLARQLGISFATVARLWRKWNLQPWRVETFKFSTDPELDAKIRDVVGLYLNPPDKAIVLSIDEKAQVQATGRVAVVVPHLARWFFGAILEAIDDVLRDAGLDVLLYHVGDLQDRRKFFDQLPARRKVDAVVVVAFPIEGAEQERLELLGVHIVAAGGQHAVYPSVCIDDVVAARQAMAHLLLLGHRRIAMIEAIDPDQPNNPSGRSAGYYEALHDAAIDVDTRLVVGGNWGGEEGAQAAAKLLSLQRPPTAIYAHSDEVAAGALRTLRRAGLRIPQDMSLIGIDDHPVANLIDLTTIGQPVREQGTAAAELVLRLLRNETDIDRAVTFPTRLIVRHSTAPPPPQPMN